MMDSREALDSIAKGLNLPKGDMYTQDWVLELPSRYFSYEYFERYLEYYKKHSANFYKEESIVLIHLLLETTDSLLTQNHETGMRAWKKLEPIIRKELSSSSSAIEMYIPDHSIAEDEFELTPLLMQALSQED